jgi:hypothetical protein
MLPLRTPGRNGTARGEFRKTKVIEIPTIYNRLELMLNNLNRSSTFHKVNVFVQKSACVFIYIESVLRVKGDRFSLCIYVSFWTLRFSNKKQYKSNRKTLGKNPLQKCTGMCVFFFLLFLIANTLRRT